MTACDVCDAPGQEVGYAGLRRCESCSHVWADLAIDTETIQRLYGRSYFFGDEYGDYLGDRRTLEKNFAGRLGTLRAFLTPMHRRLFEVGCAYGFFLNAARGLFSSARGIDVSADAVRYATTELGLDVTSGDLLTADLADVQFDVVCLWDTIEHLATPRRYLEVLAEHMPKGALITVTTGDIGSLNARLQKGRWRLIHPPTHLHYFTRRSLTAMLERCGFRVVHVEYSGFYRSVGGMLHNLVALRWGWPRLGEWLRQVAPADLDVCLNLRDIMYIIAERR